MSATRRYLERRHPGTSQDHAAEWLTHAIIAGEYGPGDRVPQEEVAARIGISLIPVREALRRLEGDGQLAYRQRRGYFVSELTAAEMTTVFDLRGVLEDHLQQQAMPGVTEVDMTLLTECVAGCTDALAHEDVIGVVTLHWRFFATVLGGQRQPRGLRLIRQLWDVTNPYAAAYYKSSANAEWSERARAGVLEGMRQRDSAAVRFSMHEHRERALAALLEFAKPEDLDSS